jgi:hypothetical protein
MSDRQDSYGTRCGMRGMAWSRYLNLMLPKDRSAAGGWAIARESRLSAVSADIESSAVIPGHRNDDRESGTNRPANARDQLRCFCEVAFTAGWKALAVLLPELVSLASRLDCGQGPGGQEG